MGFEVTSNFIYIPDTSSKSKLLMLSSHMTLFTEIFCAFLTWW